MEFDLSKEQVKQFNKDMPGIKALELPKYARPLLNLANYTSQATRPAAVGQLTEIFKEYVSSVKTVTLKGWELFYKRRCGEKINEAKLKIFNQLQEFARVIPMITPEMVKDWTEELIIEKTFQGLSAQGAILAQLAQIKNEKYRKSTPKEEAIGIDGFIGDVPYSVKPITYKTMNRLPESIEVKMIYYDEYKDNFVVTIED